MNVRTVRGFRLIKTNFWFLESMKYRRDDDYNDDDDDEMSAPVKYGTSITQGKVSG